MRNVSTSINSATELGNYFHDETIFLYEKGDVEYFINMYNAVTSNLIALKNYIRIMVIDDRAISTLFFAALLCAFAEMLYLEMDPELMMIEYTKMMNNYGELGTNQAFQKVADAKDQCLDFNSGKDLDFDESTANNICVTN